MSTHPLRRPLPAAVLLLALTVLAAGCQPPRKRADPLDNYPGVRAGVLFLTSLSTGEIDQAYNSTTPAFQASMSKADLKKLVDAHPAFSKPNTQLPTDTPTPVGVAPERRMTITYLVAPPITPGGARIGAAPKNTPKADGGAKPKDDKEVSVVVTVDEQADQSWKVSGFKIAD